MKPVKVNGMLAVPGGIIVSPEVGGVQIGELWDPVDAFEILSDLGYYRLGERATMVPVANNPRMGKTRGGKPYRQSGAGVSTLSYHDTFYLKEASCLHKLAFGPELYRGTRATYHLEPMDPGKETNCTLVEWIPLHDAACWSNMEIFALRDTVVLGRGWYETGQYSAGILGIVTPGPCFVCVQRAKQEEDSVYSVLTFKNEGFEVSSPVPIAVPLQIGMNNLSTHLIVGDQVYAGQIPCNEGGLDLGQKVAVPDEVKPRITFLDRSIVRTEGNRTVLVDEVALIETHRFVDGRIPQHIREYRLLKKADFGTSEADVALVLWMTKAQTQQAVEIVNRAGGLQIGMGQFGPGELQTLLFVRKGCGFSARHFDEEGTHRCVTFFNEGDGNFPSDDWRDKSTGVTVAAIRY